MALQKVARPEQIRANLSTNSLHFWTVKPIYLRGRHIGLFSVQLTCHHEQSCRATGTSRVCALAQTLERWIPEAIVAHELAPPPAFTFAQRALFSRSWSTV